MKSLIPIFVLGCLLTFSGCGQGLTDVTGVVSVDGTPKANLEVTFEPVGREGGSAIGYTNEAGEYKLHYPGKKIGIPPGDYVVRIQGAEVDDVGVSMKVPAKYNTASDLNRTVTTGEAFNFNIETK